MMICLKGGYVGDYIYIYAYIYIQNYIYTEYNIYIYMQFSYGMKHPPNMILASSTVLISCLRITLPRQQEALSAQVSWR